ncbi:MAG: MFS transporter [Halieaceae bacterium]|jgi:glycoside/pentoside/hexuronide:cation symporter, GPH family|nr:MFS transporter [Halieaceae bacterium]
MTAQSARVPVFTKTAYGVGSVAYGVKNNGFDYFFLLFYSQVLGVDASLVGTALLIALVFDAISDPLIGYLSDNTHSRWGRRHPYMYAAAVPISVSYFYIWNPPESLTGNELFWYITVLAIAVRTLITLYEVPSSALAAELSDDYDERTSMLSYRYFFGWSGGTLLATFALAFLLVPTETITNGMFNIEGFGKMGLLASVVIFTAIMASALGTHSRIPTLRDPPAKRKITLRRIYRELFETLVNRSFLSLFLAALFGAIATGLAAGLSYYFNTYFWEFSNQQISYLSISVVISALIGFVISPVISRKMGKKTGAIACGIIAFTTAPLPIALRLLGWMPDNGSPILFPIILASTVLDVGLIISYQTLMAAMIADVVEESELKTQRRSEGVFFAAVTFTRKLVQGFGVMSATVILSIAQFPKAVLPGDIPEDVLFKLGGLYAPSIFGVWMLMIACLSLYRIDRNAHERNLAALAANRNGRPASQR